MASSSSFLFFGRRLRAGLNVGLGTHIVLTLTSLAYATGRLGGASNLLPQSSEDDDEKSIVIVETFDAHHYKLLTQFVTSLYAGKNTVIHNYNNARQKSSSSQPPPPQQPQQQSISSGVQLADSITFEDPAGICQGPTEVMEAFRALTSLQPHCVTPPRCIHVQPKGETITITYALHQRYGHLGWLELRSLLLVDVKLEQMKSAREFNEFCVVNMQEQWNGVPLLGHNSLLFWIVRRINGILSFQLTSRLLPTAHRQD